MYQMKLLFNHLGFNIFLVLVTEIYILKVKGLILIKGEENLEVYNLAASAQTKSEDLPFDISWMTDWIVDWFGSLFNGGSDVIKDGEIK